jgi:hypothetical protein
MHGIKKALIGRTIVQVDLRPFPDGRGGTAHDPVLTLDDGKQLRFWTEETDVGAYGTTIVVSKRTSKAKAKIMADDGTGWTGH